MAKNQKSYTPVFKQQIVELYNAGGTSYPQLEREYGVNRSTLSNWVKQLSPMKYLKKRPPYSQKNNSRNCDFYPEPFKPLHSVPALQCPEIPQEYLLQGSGSCTLKQAGGV